VFFIYFDRHKLSWAHRIDPQAVIRRLMSYSSPDKSGFLADDGSSLLIQCVHWNTTQSRLEPAPLYHTPSQTAAASWARLDNRDELGKKLAIAPAALAGFCDTELILFSYLKWQEACVDHLIGDFVFVIHDRPRQKIFCGRDHLGVRPFYYFASEDVFVCATSPAALLHLETVPVRIDPQWVAEYLVGLSWSFDRTPYIGIKKLPPAHCLTITPQQIQLRQYFELSAEPALKLKDSREYVDAYREQLETAIKCRLDSGYAIGSELSGGIDSSTITAYAAKFLDQSPSRLHTFASALAELEPQYIMAVSRACRLSNNHVFAGRETESLAVLRRSLDLLGYPVEHIIATLHEPFYRLAEKLEVRTLLSGFGGDEFGTTIHGYLVPLEMLLQRRFRDLLNILPGNALFRFLRLTRLEWRRRKTGNFQRPEYNPRFYEAFRKRWPHRIIRDDLVERYDLEQRYFDIARFDAGYTDLKRFTLEKRWQPFVPTRMENCTLMAAGRKIEYRWPLLDIRLVRLFLSIPSEENYYRGMGRYLHRRAIDGTVPKMVVWKQGKKMGPVIVPNQVAAAHLCQMSASGLHPAIGEYIVTDRWRQQMEQLKSNLNGGMDDVRRFQFNTNHRAVTNISEWMKQVDMPEKGMITPQ
jgi:asparagine synthase (glutamine-hydrolysing)